MDSTSQPVTPVTSDNVTLLESDSRKIYIVGTAHISEDSVNEVNSVIEQIKPDTVAVELCESRYKALTDENRWKNLDIFKVIKEGKMLFLLANLAIGAYQRRLGQKLGVKPGAEMLAGVKKAEEVGAELALIDRDIHVTLKRTWANVGFWRRIQLMGAITEGLVSKAEVNAEDIEKLKEKTELSEMMSQFAEVLPEVQQPLIDERDKYLMSGIQAAPGDTIVAVVGAGHVEGMTRYFNQPINREELEVIPEPTAVAKALKWVIPCLILAAFSVGYFKHQGESLENMIEAWVLPNSILAALFTTIALAKPLSILAAFIASPITSLNPLLPAGVVVGLVEAWLRKPTVEDAEKINDDVQNLQGIYRNAFTRVLLVAVMATFGSAAGAWVGIGWLVKIVAGDGSP